MSSKELNRHFIIKQCVESKIYVRQAAERLGLSTRRIKQLKKEFKQKGAGAVIHGNAKRPSPKRIDQEIADKILALRGQDELNKSNFTHFHEILLERYGLKISYSTLYRLLSKAGIKSPKKRRKRKKVNLRLFLATLLSSI